MFELLHSIRVAGLDILGILFLSQKIILYDLYLLLQVLFLIQKIFFLAYKGVL